MSAQNKESFEDAIRNKVIDHETAYSDDAWIKMEQMLETKKKLIGLFRFNKFIRILYPTLLVLFVSSLVGYDVWKSAPGLSGDPVRNQKSGQQIEKESILKKTVTTEKNKVIADAKTDVSIFEGNGISIKHEGHSLIRSTYFANSDHQLPKGLSNNAIAGNNTSLGVQYESNSNKNLNGLDKNQKAVPIEKTNPGSQGDSNQSKKIAVIPKPKTTITNIQKPANNINDKKGFSFRPVSFGIFLGFDFLFTFNQNSSSFQFNGPSSLGAFVNFPFSDNFSIQSGLSYSEIAKDLWRNDTTYVSNDSRGPMAQITQTYTQAIDYIQLPILLKYKLSKKFLVTGGVQVSYAFGIYGGKYISDQKIDSLRIISPKYADSSYKSLTFKDVPEINRFSLEIPIGIQWNISHSIDLSVMYFLGVTNILKSQYHYLNTQGNNNNLLQLRLSYKLFHKKFSGE